MGIGRLRKRHFPVKARPWLVGAKDILEGHHMGSWFHSLDVDLGQLVHVVKDRGQLPGEGVYFVFTQPQPREAGDMQDLFALNHEGESRWKARSRACLLNVV